MTSVLEKCIQALSITVLWSNIDWTNDFHNMFWAHTGWVTVHNGFRMNKLQGPKWLLMRFFNSLQYKSGSGFLGMKMQRNAMNGWRSMLWAGYILNVSTKLSVNASVSWYQESFFNSICKRGNWFIMYDRLFSYMTLFTVRNTALIAPPVRNVTLIV